MGKCKFPPLFLPSPGFHAHTITTIHHAGKSTKKLSPLPENHPVARTRTAVVHFSPPTPRFWKTQEHSFKVSTSRTHGSKKIDSRSDDADFSRSTRFREDALIWLEK